MSSPKLLMSCILVLTSFAAWELLFAQGTDGPRTDEAATLKQLAVQVEALEQRVKALEGQLSSVDPANKVIVPSPLIAAPSDQPAGRVPQDWKAGEINGLRFYTIPLNKPEAP